MQVIKSKKTPFFCTFFNSLIVLLLAFQGTWRDVTWPDEWTSTTVDGRRSAQFEHTLVVTETGK